MLGDQYLEKEASLVAMLHKGQMPYKHSFYSGKTLRYFVPQVRITGKMLNEYLMFSVKNIGQNVQLIELWGKNVAPLHFVISKI